MPRRGEDADTSGEGTSWIVLRHTQAEGLGLIANALRDYGVHHRVLDVPRGDPLPKDIRGVGGVIVLGGPMAVYESDRYPFLQAETTFVEKMIAAGRPALGVCLGAQLIAQILGARVFPGEHREVGWAPVEIVVDERGRTGGGGQLLGERRGVQVVHLERRASPRPPLVVTAPAVRRHQDERARAR